MLILAGLDFRTAIPGGWSWIGLDPPSWEAGLEGLASPLQGTGLECLDPPYSMSGLEEACRGVLRDP